MNFKINESDQKLSGSYYTPEWLAMFLTKWVLHNKPRRILENSCGDGIFITSLAKHGYKGEFLGFDINEQAVAKSQDNLARTGISGHVICEDYLKWTLSNLESGALSIFDGVLGNPPFIRYQYMDKEVQEETQRIFSKMGLRFTKHTNIWVAFVLSALHFLQPGGRMGIVIPAEVINVIYADSLRRYLIDTCSQILLFDPSDIWFEDTLQGAMLLLAQKKSEAEQNCNMRIIETKGNSFSENNPEYYVSKLRPVPSHLMSAKWTLALLNDEAADLIDHLSTSSPFVRRFRDIAKVDVGIVTGANKYFLVDDATVEAFGLGKLTLPMYGRSEYCNGLIYDNQQHTRNRENGLPVNFIDFRKMEDEKEYKAYILKGIAEELDKRYKCRIRNPWYIVPSIYPSPISLLKRSNGYPRLIFNDMEIYTTDTAYRVFPFEGIDSQKLVFSFLNTLTSLSAELEGRAYGGGVLELVPSEIENLLVPYLPDGDCNLRELDLFARENDIEAATRRQDSIILKGIGLDDHEIRILQNALETIMKRRKKESD